MYVTDMRLVRVGMLEKKKVGIVILYLKMFSPGLRYVVFNFGRLLCDLSLYLFFRFEEFELNKNVVVRFHNKMDK